MQTDPEIAASVKEIVDKLRLDNFLVEVKEGLEPVSEEEYQNLTNILIERITEIRKYTRGNNQ